MTTNSVTETVSDHATGEALLDLANGIQHVVAGQESSDLEKLCRIVQLLNSALDDFCHICMKIEPMRDPTYIICFECKHKYYTPKDLIQAYIDSAPDDMDWATVTIQADQISFCPLCIHDFA